MLFAPCIQYVFHLSFAISYCFVIEGKVKAKVFEPLDLLIGARIANDCASFDLGNLSNKTANCSCCSSYNNSLSFKNSQYQVIKSPLGRPHYQACN